MKNQKSFPPMSAEEHRELALEHLKQLRKTRVTYILMGTCLIIWAVFYWQYNKTYTAIYESEVKILSKAGLQLNNLRNVVAKPVIASEMEPLDIKQKIVKSAIEAGINPQEAREVIDCESDFNPKATSKVSTAKGLAQFLNGTWRDYCEGDVYNEDDNLRCFIELYPKHKSWWECAKLKGYIN